MQFQPGERLTLKLDLALNHAQAGLQRFRFPGGEAFAAPRPHQSFDFSMTHTDSDLDTRFLEAGLEARFAVGEDVHLTAGYRHLDFDDNAPYLGDDSGTVEFVSLGVGWAF